MTAGGHSATLFNSQHMELLLKHQSPDFIFNCLNNYPQHLAIDEDKRVNLIVNKCPSAISPDWIKENGQYLKKAHLGQILRDETVAIGAIIALAKHHGWLFADLQITKLFKHPELSVFDKLQLAEIFWPSLLRYFHDLDWSSRYALAKSKPHELLSVHIDQLIEDSDLYNI